MDVFLHNFFNIETLIVYYPILLRGLWMTLLLASSLFPSAFMYYILLLPLVRIVSRMERKMISSH